jgi:glutamate/tyrosine decarboxylase-like PLP-dependent enzyme
MAVPKGVAMLGIGRNLHYVPCDGSYRMVPSLLERAIQQDEAQGPEPTAVVASAGTVNTGSIDPLREIAAIAQFHDLWMHVDGAYGALAAIAAPEKFDGLARADSLSLDPHKWMYRPLDSRCLLYRDIGSAQSTFTIPAAMPNNSALAQLTALRFSKSRSNFPAASAPRRSGSRCATTGCTLSVPPSSKTSMMLNAWQQRSKTLLSLIFLVRGS